MRKVSLMGTDPGCATHQADTYTSGLFGCVTLFSSYISYSNRYNGIKEGNVLFNDALNTFGLWLHCVGHIVKAHSDSERGNPPPHGLFFLMSSKGSFICIIPQTGYTYHGLCYNSRGELARMRNSSMGPP